MLALTPTATEVVESIVSNDELPETAGLRITSEENPAAGNSHGPRRDLRLAIVEEPETGDELIEGTQIYVEPGETADLLDDKVLDAEVSGEEVRFSLLQQEGSDPG
jgi:iron-sulfur cluster assembly protein